MLKDFIKEQLGDLKYEYCHESFLQGYDLISDLVDQYEYQDDDENCYDNYLDYLSDIQWEKTYNILSDLNVLTPNDENYDTIYKIDFYTNGFYYSKKVDDNFREEWNTWDETFLQGGKSRSWYLYFINKRIELTIKDQEILFEMGVFEETSEGFIPFVEDDPNDLNNFWEGYEN